MLQRPSGSTDDLMMDDNDEDAWIHDHYHDDDVETQHVDHHDNGGDAHPKSNDGILFMNDELEEEMLLWNAAQEDMENNNKESPWSSKTAVADNNNNDEFHPVATVATAHSNTPTTTTTNSTTSATTTSMMTTATATAASSIADNTKNGTTAAAATAAAVLRLSSYQNATTCRHDNGNDIYYNFERYTGIVPQEWGQQVFVAPSSDSTVVPTKQRQHHQQPPPRPSVLQEDQQQQQQQRRDISSSSSLCLLSALKTSSGAQLVQSLDQTKRWNRITRRKLFLSLQPPQQQQQPSSNNDDNPDSGASSRSCIRTIPKQGEDCVPMTLGNGTRVYVRQQQRPLVGAAAAVAKATKDTPPPSHRRRRLGLLSVPMTELIRRSDAMQKASILIKTQTNTDNHSLLSSSSPPRNNNISNNNYCSPTATTATNHNNNNNYLWVDKHAPTSFSHLLSDESINRDVLRALRAWDPYVFRRAPPRKRSSPPPTYYHTAGNQSHQHGTRSSSDSSKNKMQQQHSKTTTTTSASSSPKHDTRPDEHNRVILLSGPPGVGKTTLAHILAKHAGYRPMEINASEERCATVLKERVLSAMDSTTLCFKAASTSNDVVVATTVQGRPNCLILDEIDGADAKGAVAALVEIIRAEMPSAPHSRVKGNKTTTITTTSKKKTIRKPFLQRPMIFICNHKYAPALKPLLPYCRQFDVTAPSTVRLLARLGAILHAEHVTVGGASGNLLNRLIKSSGGDIRSCLYTLQLAAETARAQQGEAVAGRQEDDDDHKDHNANGSSTTSRCHAHSFVDIAPTLLATGAVGGNGNNKDERNDLANILSSVFRKWKEQRCEEKSVVRSNKSTRSASSTLSKASVDRVMDLVKSFDDQSKTLDGMFMNIMRVSYIDPTMDRCAAAHEWLSGSDLFRSWRMLSMDGGGGYTMQSWHIPPAAAAIHLMCRVETRPDLTFSTRQLSDLYFEHEANIGLAQRFLEGMPVQARTSIKMNCLVTETIPYALWMLSAGQGSGSLSRPVSGIERLTTSELQAFQCHARTLLTLGLKYVTTDHFTSNSFGTVSQLRLEPPIDALVRFSDFHAGTCPDERSEISAALKELLAQYVVQEGMRERVATAAANIPDDENVTFITQPPPPPLSHLGKENKLTLKCVTNEKDLSPTIPSVQSVTTTTKTKLKTPPLLEPSPKRAKTTFLGVGAAKVKAARTAKRVAKVGFHQHNTGTKLSHTGSGVPLDQVVRFKYQKGCTQAVRTPCRWEDLVG